jgi:hypothetical protein
MLTGVESWSIDSLATVTDRARLTLSEPKLTITSSSVIIVPMNSATNLTPQQLRAAADIQERILDLQNELSQLLGDTSSTYSPPQVSGKRRLSAQGLANIRAGARKRWAKVRLQNGGSAPRARARRTMPPSARQAIAARMRARWAAAKRAGRNAL